MFPSFNYIHKIGIGLISLSLFALVLCLGGWSGLQISKRQFETEAQNIVAVLRSGMSVVDGVATSLAASDYSTTTEDYEQLEFHAGKVLGNFDFVTGLARFESVADGDLNQFKSVLAARTSGSGRLWFHDDAGNAMPILNNSGRYFPLSLVKPGFDASNQSIDLTGLDIGSVDGIRRSILHSSAKTHTIITPLPASWQRNGDLLVVRTSHDKVTEDLNGGYLLELDVERMASSGGVDLRGFELSLSMFGEQGEFAAAEADQLYYRDNRAKGGYLFSDWFKDNRWLSTFSTGEKTLILEVGRQTGLSNKLAATTLLAGLLLPLMFLTIVHLNVRRRAAQRLQRIESEKLYRAQNHASVTLSSIGDSVITTDVNNVILYANSAAETLLGQTAEAMRGHAIEEIVVLRKERSTDQISENDELTLKSADGSLIYVNRIESVLEDSDGKDSGKVVVLRDVSVERSLTQALQYKVNHDPLTGLSNRLHFEQEIDALFSDPKPSKLGYGLCFIDLDRFKEVNDTCGHGAGDDLLVRISKAFIKNVRDVDLVSRLGGDEFGIIINSCSKPDTMIVAERIKKFFESFYFEYDDHVFPVRCSIGLVHFNPEKSNRDDVLKTADAACYDAKNSGRNNICRREVGDLSGTDDGTVLWLPRLKDALENEKFSLHVQSIVSLANGSVSRHEFYLRLQEDDGSMVGPQTFMKTAVRYQLALDIDRWVVYKALAFITNLPSQFGQDNFSINLSSQSIGSTEFIDFLSRQITLSGIDATRLCFDIKEADLLNDPVRMAEFCQELRALGCTVALDDFGAGMTSLTALKSLPVSVLKIDGSLIANLSNPDSGSANEPDSRHEADLALVSSIHNFASTMGLITIAEQVESLACLNALKQLQIDYAQGYAISDVVALDEFVASIQQRAA